VCVFFVRVGFWNWKAKLGLQLSQWKLHLYTMHSSCPKFRVLPRSCDSMCSCVGVCGCVCRIKLSTLCLWLELRVRIEHFLFGSPGLLLLFIGAQKFAMEAAKFWRTFSPPPLAAAAKTIKSVSTHWSYGHFLSQAYRITRSTWDWKGS